MDFSADIFLATAITVGTVVLIVAILLGAIIFVIVMVAKIGRAWAQAATTLGGTYTSGSKKRIDALIGSVSVVLTYSPGGGEFNPATTRVCAPVPELSPFTLALRFRDELSSLSRAVAKLVSAGPISLPFATGDAAFDAAFLIETNDPSSAHVLLTEPVRAALLAVGRCGVRIGQEVRIVWSGDDSDPDKLVASAHAVAALATRLAEMARM